MRVLDTKSEQFLVYRKVFFKAENRNAKGGRKWLGPGVIIGRFRGKYAIVRICGSYLEVDIEDMRPENRSLGIIGRDGALQLRLPSTEFPTHYLVYSKTLIALSEMGNAILNRNQTTWGNTDARLGPGEFYDPTLNRRVAIHDLWGKRLMISRIA